MLYYSAFANAGHHQKQVTKQVDSSFTKLLEILLTPVFPLYSFVYTKKIKAFKQFRFTSWTDLILSSKHLPFLSLQTDHLIISILCG